MRNFLLIILLTIFSNLQGQNITQDITFGDVGYSAINIQSINNLTNSVLLQDGTYITCHVRTTSVGWTLTFEKFDSNGIKDTSFSGTFSLDGAITFKNFVLHNNKLIVIGNYSIYPYNNRNTIVARFDLNGDLDTSFATNGYTIISYGSFNDDPIEIVNDNLDNSYIYSKHSTDHYLAKLKPDGTLDNSFGTDGLLFLHSYTNSTNSNYTDNLTRIFLQNDGKILLAGAKKNLTNDLWESYVVRKFLDGSVDTSFGNNGELIFPDTENSRIKDLEFDYNNNSITILHQYGANFISDRVFLSKIQISDGAFISSFGNNGITTKHFFSDAPDLNLKHLKVLSNSKILVAGSASNFSVSPSINTQLFIMRFNPDGSIDYSSSSNGFHIFDATPPDTSMRADFVNNLIDLNDGSFVLAYSGDSAINGAKSYLTKFNGATLGLNDLNIDISDYLTISPNPTSEFITVRHTQNLKTNFKYKIIDIIGRTLKTGYSKFNESIKIEGLPSGTYIIYVISELGEKFSSKILID